MQPVELRAVHFVFCQLPTAQDWDFAKTVVTDANVEVKVQMLEKAMELLLSFLN